MFRSEELGTRGERRLYVNAALLNSDFDQTNREVVILSSSHSGLRDLAANSFARLYVMNKTSGN